MTIAARLSTSIEHVNPFRRLFPRAHLHPGHGPDGRGISLSCLRLVQLSAYVVPSEIQPVTIINAILRIIRHDLIAYASGKAPVPYADPP